MQKRYWWYSTNDSWELRYIQPRWNRTRGDRSIEKFSTTVSWESEKFITLTLHNMFTQKDQITMIHNRCARLSIVMWIDPRCNPVFTNAVEWVRDDLDLLLNWE